MLAYSGNQTLCIKTGDFPPHVQIIDWLRVPADTPPGEYVLGWRWDGEQSAQIWQGCSDITITRPAIVEV